jgi:hypothetical protein
MRVPWLRGETAPGQLTPPLLAHAPPGKFAPILLQPANGNPGKFRRITAKVSELKIEFGPGYRVYYDSLEDEDW